MKSLQKISLKDITNSKKTGNILFYLSAFMLPFVIMLIAFIALRIYPFGGNQIMVQDAWHQYYPFMAELHRKLQNGESLLYDWRIGLGGGFLPLMAYYLASPLNLLLLFWPAAFLREAFALFILIKIGFAGVFCAYALYKINHKKEYGIIIFSTLYALCSWTCSYYCTIMWLDTFAVFPLVVTGIQMLVKEKKCRLYTISLAFAIFANYYMGLLVCIFTVVYFFAQCVLCQNSLKELLYNLKNIIISSIISILMSAVVLVPVVMTMSTQSSIAGNHATVRWQTKRGWVETIANTFAYREIDIDTVLPNLYCGVICVVFLFAFYRLSGISRREKVVHTALLLLFYAGINIELLSYILNGLHTPNGMPYRFSFMLSFLLIMSAYQVYTRIETLSKRDWLFMCIAGTAYYVIVAGEEIWRNFMEASSEEALDSAVADGASLPVLLFGNALIIAAYFFLTFPGIRTKLSRKEFTLLLTFIVEMELVPTVMTGTKSIGVTDRESYPYQYNEIREVLEEVEKREEDDSFYRVDFTKPYVHNASALYDYYGISAYTSSANTNVCNFYYNMGLGASTSVYIYQNSTPVINALLGMKYLISRDSKVTNEEYLSALRQAGEVTLYRNISYLPVGFMVDDQLSDFTFAENAPFENQNNFLKAASGIDDDVFEKLDIIHVEHENLDVLRYGYGIYTYKYKLSADASDFDDMDEQEKGFFKYNYEMPRDGCVYAYMKLPKSDLVSVEFEEEESIYNNKRPYIFPAGTYKQGDLFSIKAEVEAETSGDLQIYVSVFNEEVFDRCYEVLQDEALNITEVSSRGMKGNIVVKEDGLLYTSIPYESGWKVYVDGLEAEILPIGNSFIGIMLSDGEHVIEMRYMPNYVYVAAILLMTGLILLFIQEKRETKDKNMHC